MIVGACKFTLELSAVFNLKEKRSVVSSIKQKIMNTFKVFVSEVEALEDLNTAVLGFALAGNDANFIRDLIDKITNYIEEHEGIKITYDKVEVLQF
ncbi:MAG: DUF503 domain-containing protein [Deltaproteobacteria bacterium]|nr:DUF503 domain-containing protein [Deltaproteobacteria bacterium]